MWLYITFHIYGSLWGFIETSDEIWIVCRESVMGDNRELSLLLRKQLGQVDLLQSMCIHTYIHTSRPRLTISHTRKMASVGQQEWNGISAALQILMHCHFECVSGGYDIDLD